MSITVTDPRGQFINTQHDVLQINTISYTANVAIVGSNLELVATNAYPYDDNAVDRKYIQITTQTYFSNRLFRIGDRIIIKKFAMDNSAANNARFAAYITRPEGHMIINLDIDMPKEISDEERNIINNLKNLNEKVVN